jgi:23S rRNA G2069 N7-methylase RlmK/C1962 C5-methylase RlmI
MNYKEKSEDLNTKSKFTKEKEKAQGKMRKNNIISPEIQTLLKSEIEELENKTGLVKKNQEETKNESQKLIEDLTAELEGAKLQITQLQKEKKLEINRIYNLDCLELFKKMKKTGIKVDAIIADPPYNISKSNNFSSIGRAGIDFGY